MRKMIKLFVFTILLENSFLHFSFEKNNYLMNKTQKLFLLQVQPTS